MKTATKTATRANAKANTALYNWHGTPAHTMSGKANAWPLKLAGPKPTVDQLALAASLIKRHGTAKHLALAMYLRENGATQPEVNAATGDTGINAYTDAYKGGSMAQRAVNGRAGHKCYALALPVKRASKPRKAKAKADKPATVEAPAAGTTEQA